MPEDAVLVEGEASVALEISPDARGGGDALTECRDEWIVRHEARHPAREGIAEPGDGLEQAEIGISQAIRNQMLATPARRSRLSRAAVKP